jgi:hypothetical protein
MVILAVLIGCYRPDPQEGAACSELGRCPYPLQCDQGICRRLPIDAGPDAEPDDAPVDAPGCAPIQPTLGTFSMPVRSLALSSPTIDGTPALRADRLEMYFKSYRGGGPGGAGDSNLWQATRTSLAQPWSAPVLVAELSTLDYEGSPELSADALTLWFVSTRPPSLGIDVWVATRATAGSTWNAPTHVPELSSPGLEEGIVVMPSQLVAYLHSDRAGGNNVVYRAARSSVTEPWSTPVPVAGLPTTEHYQNPWLTDDECTMYIASDRADSQGLFDIFVATRTQPDAAFGLVTPVMELASSGYDADPWLTPNQRYIMFASDRPVGTGNFDLFEATR